MDGATLSNVALDRNIGFDVDPDYAYRADSSHVPFFLRFNDESARTMVL